MSARHRSALLLAVCGLLLSPGMTAAAAPNQLSNGGVTPGTGTTQTTFTFSVVYSSERDFAATGVVALVAGSSVTLSLVSGTSTAGTHQGSASLPAGTWPVTFQAQATQGPDATLAGPTVVVSAPATPQPVPVTPAPTPKPVIAPPLPTPRPAAAATATPPRATPIPTEVLPGAATEPPTGSTAPPASSGGPPAGASDPRGSGGSATPSMNESSMPGVGGSLSPPLTDDGPDGSPSWLLIVGSAVAGLTLLIAWRRRASGTDEAVLVAASHADEDPISLAARTRQRQAAAAPNTEDPILAAMGVGAPLRSQAQLNAPLSRQVRSGPGERPEPAKSRRQAG